MEWLSTDYWASLHLSEWSGEACVKYSPSSRLSSHCSFPPNPTRHSISRLCHCACCSFYVVLPNPLLFFKICLNSLLLLLFCPSYNLYSELNCTLYVSYYSTALTLLKLLAPLPPLGNGACFLSCILPGVAQCVHRPGLDGPEILLVSVNTLSISPQTQNSELIQTHNLELFSPLTHFKIFLASVPDSKLSLMRKVNTTHGWLMPIPMLKLIIIKGRFLSLGNHEDSTLAYVNSFLSTGSSEITEEIDIWPCSGKSTRSILLNRIAVGVRSARSAFRRQEWSWSVFPDAVCTMGRKNGYWLQLGLWMAGQLPKKVQPFAPWKYLTSLKLRILIGKCQVWKDESFEYTNLNVPQWRICSTKICTL